jgi:hypothetical protein
MTFDEAYDLAANDAIRETVAGPRTWSGWLRGEAKGTWRPGGNTRFLVSEAIRPVCRRMWVDHGHLPTRREAIEAARSSCQMGPLTVLWLAVMVVRLLAGLRELLEADL